MMLDLVKKNRSYRSFDESRPVSEAEMRSMVECARFTASSNNRQFLRYRLCADAQDMAALLPCLRWAMSLPQWHLPPAGHNPTAAIVLCHDTTVNEDPRASLRDTGIKAQTILLAAAEMGLGGCMIANFAPAKVSEVLQIPAHLVPVLVIALGKPDEEILLDDAEPGSDISYYRDAHGVHHVPKRTPDELIVR